MNVRVRCQERINLLGLVRREVVGDDMDLLASRLIDHEIIEKRDELGGGMALGGLAQHLAGLGVKGRVQRQGAVAKVFEAVAFCASRRQRQHRVFAIERLNRRLLVHAELELPRFSRRCGAAVQSVRQMTPLVIDGRQIVERRVAAMRVIPPLDEVEDPGRAPRAGA